MNLFWIIRIVLVSASLASFRWAHHVFRGLNAQANAAATSLNKGETWIRKDSLPISSTSVTVADWRMMRGSQPIEPSRS